MLLLSKALSLFCRFSFSFLHLAKPPRVQKGVPEIKAKPTPMEIWKGSVVQIAVHIKLTQSHLFVVSHRDGHWEGDRLDRDFKRSILNQKIEVYVRVLSPRLIDVSMKEKRFKMYSDFVFRLNKIQCLNVLS